MVATVPAVRAWKAKGLRQYLVRFVKGHGCRFDLLDAARVDGVASDLKFMLVLPAKERALYENAAELGAWGGRRPPFREVIPAAVGPRAVLVTVGECETDRWGNPAAACALLGGEGRTQRVDLRYHLTILDRYPSADFYLSAKPNGPVLYRVGSEVVGLVMPFAD